LLEVQTWHTHGHGLIVLFCFREEGAALWTGRTNMRCSFRWLVSTEPQCKRGHDDRVVQVWCWAVCDSFVIEQLRFSRRRRFMSLSRYDTICLTGWHWRSRLVFGRCSVRILSAFSRSLEVNGGIVSQATASPSKSVSNHHPFISVVK
jgi:hypothetical protein